MDQLLGEKMVKDRAPDAEFPFAELVIEPIRLELGFDIVPLAGGTLIDRIATLRRELFNEIGLLLPSIHIRDNLNLESNQYALFIADIEVIRSTVYPDYLGVVPNPRIREKIQSQLIARLLDDPFSAQKIVLINREAMRSAANLGYSVLDASALIIRHLRGIFIKYAPQLLDREQLILTLDLYSQKYPKLIEETTQIFLQSTVLLKVLRNLLRENLSIRNLPAILEILLDHAEATRDPKRLSKLVRRHLKLKEYSF